MCVRQQNEPFNSWSPHMGTLSSGRRYLEKENQVYARVLTATVQSGRLEELARAVQEVVQTTIKQRQGFKQALVLTDLSTNKVMAISLCETQADLDAHVAAGRVPKHWAEAAKALTAPYVEEFYEVSFQE